MSFQRELAEKLSVKTGCKITEEHIHSDNPGYHYYIRDLQSEHPLFLIHYRTVPMCILPDADFQRLSIGQITPEDYIDQARWSYGRYWGGGSLLGGIYWQPLEDTRGIHDTATISRYLQILMCRTLAHSSGYRPTTTVCCNCKLDSTTCPLSAMNLTGDWATEIQEPDARVELLKVLQHWLDVEYGFEKVYTVLTHRGKINEVHLMPPANRSEDCVTLVISTALHNAMLDKTIDVRVLDQLVRSFKFKTGQGFPKTTALAEIPSDVVDPHQFCLDCWGFSEDEDLTCTDEDSQANDDNHPLFGWLHRLVKK